MRTTILTLTVLIFILLVSGFVLAEELPSPGLLPDHPFYGVKRWWEGVQLWFTFDHVAKAKFHSHLAEVRLAEANAMAERGRPEFVQSLMKDYSSEINTTEDILDTEKAAGRNVTDVEETVANATHKHLAVLERLLEKVPEPARIHIEHAINASSKGCIRALERIRESNPERSGKLASRFAEVDLNRSKELIEKARIRWAQRRLEIYRKLINETEKASEKAEKLGRNVTALAEHICNMTYKHVYVLEEVLEKVPDEAKPAIEKVINASLARYEKCIERITKAINKSTERWKSRSCTSDADCEKILTYCPTKFGFIPTCYIPPNRTVGMCYCRSEWKIKIRNCTSDVECRYLICPMVIGHDTPICMKGRCVCGARWEMTNTSEWRIRFNQTLTNETRERLWKIREYYPISKIKEEIERTNMINIP